MSVWDRARVAGITSTGNAIYVADDSTPGYGAPAPIFPPPDTPANEAIASAAALGVVTARHALGLWLTYRKTASAAYVPGARARMPLQFKVIAWYPVNFSLLARLNAEDRITTAPKFWLTYLIGSSSLAAGFRVQLYDSESNQRLGDPLNFANGLGSAARPAILRKPHYFCNRSPLLIRVQNLDVSGGTNNIQVVAVGFGE